MSNNPYEPSPSSPQPNEDALPEAQAEADSGQNLAQNSATTAPPNSDVAPHTDNAYSANSQNSSTESFGTEQNNNPYAAPQQSAETAPQPAGTQLNGATYGASQQSSYNSYGVATPQEPQDKKPKNIVGIVALASSAIGFILGLIYPWVALVGWFLLFAGFVTGIVGFFQKNKEKITPSIAVVLSILGTIASIIALIVSIASSGNSVDTDYGLPESPSSSSSGSTDMDGVLKFGETAEFDDGLKITVSEPRTDYTPSDHSKVDDPDLKGYVVFSVTVENGTGSPYDPYTLISGNSGGKEIQTVFDSAKGMSGPPSGKLLPGEKVTFDMAFAVADPNNVTLDIMLDSDRDDIIYTGK